MPVRTPAPPPPAWPLRWRSPGHRRPGRGRQRAGHRSLWRRKGPRGQVRRLARSHPAPPRTSWSPPTPCGPLAPTASRPRRAGSGRLRGRRRPRRGRQEPPFCGPRPPPGHLRHTRTRQPLPRHDDRAEEQTQHEKGTNDDRMILNEGRRLPCDGASFQPWLDRCGRGAASAACIQPRMDRAARSLTPARAGPPAGWRSAAATRRRRAARSCRADASRRGSAAGSRPACGGGPSR